MMKKMLIDNWRVPLFLCTAALLGYGLFRSVPPPELFEQSDKAAHLLAFTALGLSCRIAFPRLGNERFWMLLLPLAPLLEWLQHLVQPVTRSFSLGDAAANLSGLLLAALAWRWLQRRSPDLAAPV